MTNLISLNNNLLSNQNAQLKNLQNLSNSSNISIKPNTKSDDNKVTEKITQNQQNESNLMSIENPINTSINTSRMGYEKERKSFVKQESSIFDLTEESYVNTLKIEAFEPKVVKISWEYRNYGKITL